MQHLEGGPWQYLTIARYNSWPEFASNESNSTAQTVKGTGGWFQLRAHAAFHTDTLTSRIAPQRSKCRRSGRVATCGGVVSPPVACSRRAI